MLPKARSENRFGTNGRSVYLSNKSKLRSSYGLSPDQIQAYEDCRIYSLEIDPTNRCNADCKYCYTSRDTDATLPKNKVAQVLSEAPDLGVRQVFWLGGETLLHPEWRDLKIVGIFRGVLRDSFQNL